MKSTILAASMAALAAFPASALSINASSWGGCLGLASCSIGAATVTAGGAAATLSQSNFRKVSGLGVSSTGQGDGANAPEMQGPRTDPAFGGETITIDFAVGQHLDEIVIRHWYNPVAFANDPEEILNITGVGANGSATLIAQNIDYSGGLGDGFTVNDASLFSGFTRSPFAKPKNATNKGEFVITDLFKSLGPITRLTFAAGSMPSADTSDYTIGSISTTPVPLPAAAWLLMGGVAGIGYLGRKRRAA